MKNLKSKIITLLLIGLLLNILITTSFATEETINNEIEEIESNTIVQDENDSIYQVESNLINQNLKAAQPIKSILNIDTNLNNTSFKTTIHIEGWKLATEANTKLQIYIDNKEINEDYIKYSYKYDLISIVKGYGTYKENPTPNFDIDIPISDLKQGNHSVRIELVNQEGTVLQKSEGNIYVDKGIKSVLNIDTNLDNAVFNKTGIHIEGWRLATETNNEIVVYIDNKKMDSNYITYSYKYDLISIVKGYGTYKENPSPMFDINIPTTNLSNGKHTIKIQIQLDDGTVLQSVEKSITIDKSVKHVLNIDTNLDNAVFGKTGIQISGWRLATEADNKIVVYIDNQKVDSKYIKYSRKYDLISIVKGYGTYTENPAPMFDINIPTKDITDGTHIIKIQFVLSDGTVLDSVEKTIDIEKVKHVLNIDTNLNNATFDKYGIQISGWRLATEANNEIIVFIDNKKVDNKYIKYSRTYDLISIVKGYGTYKENPAPMFDINIPTTDLSNGKHTIKVQFQLEDGTILEDVEKVITIDKSIKHILNIDTNINALIFNEIKNIQISGWKLATEQGADLVVYLDGEKVDDNYITYSLTYDLISIVKGYGTYEENPTPMFNINIPTANLSKQNHNMKIQFMAPDGVTVLESVEFTAIYGDRYKGIDVSSHNGVVDWKQVAKSGIDFAMIRIGYRGYRNPVLVLDTQALYNLKEAKAAGLKIGVYFFSQAVNLSEAQEEALWVVSQLHQNGIQLDYPVAIDSEDTGARAEGYLPGRADLLDKDTRTMICRAFCDVINYQGFTPAVYASKNWFNEKLNFSELSNYDIWVAHHTNDENIVTDFSSDYEIWQYTDEGNVSGVPSSVDINICYKRY